MPRRCCRTEGTEAPRCCYIGNQPRFVEPVVLYLLKVNSGIHGYELMGLFGEHAITASDLDSAAIYRTLRQLEADGLVLSEWDTAGGGPPRRRYTLTPDGELRLDAWIKQLDRLSKALATFVGYASTATQ